MPAQHTLFPLASRYTAPVVDLLPADCLVLLHFEAGYPGGPFRNYGTGPNATEDVAGVPGFFGNGSLLGSTDIPFDASWPAALTFDYRANVGEVGQALAGIRLSGESYELSVTPTDVSLTHWIPNPDFPGIGLADWEIVVDIALTDWNHFQVTRYNGDWTLWINGESAGTHTDSTDFTSVSLYAQVFDGALLDEFRVMRGLAANITNFTPAVTYYSGSQSGFEDGAGGHSPALALESAGVLLLETGDVLLLE